MEIYILKSGGIMLFVLAVYYLLLRQETFYRNNRFYLLAGLTLSVVLPLITFTKVEWIEAVEISTDLSPVIVQNLPRQINAETFLIDWSQLLKWIYIIGTIAFTIKFILDFIDLRKTLRGKTIIKSGKFKIVETSENVSPFSYFNYIVYNPDLYSKIELANIIEHEKVHCRQKHSVDVIVSIIYCIIFWFNPFAWLYKKTIIQNLEFIADNEASGKISDRLSYQITLVKVTAHENCVAITNHFYQSLIKKRIVMLNKNQSNRANQWKYGIVFPAIVVFMMQFQVNVIAQQKNAKTHTATASFSENSDAKINAFMILPSTTDKELKSYEDMLQKQYGMEMKFSNILRNNKKEILRFDFWYDDKVNKPQTIYVSKDKPENLFFMINIKKDKSGKDTLKVITYDKGNTTGQSYKVEAETVTFIDEEKLSTTNKPFKNPLIIDKNGKQIAYDQNNYELLVDGSVTSISPEEAVKKYGDKAKDGALVIDGDYQLVKKGSLPEGRIVAVADNEQISKIITLENGNEVVFLKGGKVKVPGNATITFDKNSNTELIIDGVKYNDPIETIEKMDLNRIKTAYVNESWDKNDKKTVQLVMKLKS